MILLLVHGQANVERSSIVNNTILKVSRKQYSDNHQDNHQSYEKTSSIYHSLGKKVVEQFIKVIRIKKRKIARKKKRKCKISS